MNKDIQVKAQLLNQWILSQESVIEYKKYAHIVEANEDLKKKEVLLKAMQKKIINTKAKQEPSEELVKEYLKLKNELDEHPLIMNYLISKEEVNELVQSIQNDINQQINKNVD